MNQSFTVWEELVRRRNNGSGGLHIKRDTEKQSAETSEKTRLLRNEQSVVNNSLLYCYRYGVPNMTSVYPPIPRFVFTVFEPISLSAALKYAKGFPKLTHIPQGCRFIAEQLAFSPSEKLSPNAKVVALQLGNIYLLLAMVCSVSSLLLVISF
jgi:hypothetical protein